MFKKYWLEVVTVISLFIGIYGVVLTINSNKDIEPIFQIEPIRTQILSSNSIKTAPIKIILKTNGDSITKDVTSIRFYFWNDGKESIKSDNITKEIILFAGDAKIIDYKLLKSSRPDITRINLNKIDSNTLKITFNILEYQDGFTGEILVVGNPKTDVRLTGAIEGVNKIGEITMFFHSIDRFISYFNSIIFNIFIWSSALIYVIISFTLGYYIRVRKRKIVPKSGFLKDYFWFIILSAV